MSPNADGDDFDPEIDLLERYEKMVDIQIETINGIDDKAAYTGRLIALLGGVITTAVSLAASSEAITLSDTTAAVFLTIGIGIAALFVSLIYAIITYLSSKFIYGPPTGLGEYMSKYKVDSQEYRDALLDGYSSGVKQNKKVIENNADRFRRCLTALLVGLLYLSAGPVLVVLPDHPVIDAIVILGFTGAAIILALHILRKGYLTLEVEE